MKPPIWIAAAFQRRNIPVEELQQKTLLANRPVRIENKIVKNASYENVKLEKWLK